MQNDEAGHDHDQGLQHDLTIMAKRADRRQLLKWMAGASLVPLVGCGPESASDGMLAQAVEDELLACTRIPEEMAGPYPGDGSNGANALLLSGIVRSDIRTSIAGATGVARGVPLTLTLTLVNRAACAPLAGYAIYVWQCERAGLYSMYSPGVQYENFLRGVQVTNAQGKVTFTSIFPGCYPGRWPHIHFEVYPTLASISSFRNKIATSQLAFARTPCQQAYATAGYQQSAANLQPLSIERDLVFADGYANQLATTTGNVTTGFTSTLQFAI
ncbi:dioxygenase [Myxococcus stipitatus]|uniref:dioxygenase family protein n=1 Tax=Myxococcus stipitatus TaxID=83455 RepID=UPI0030CBC13C